MLSLIGGNSLASYSYADIVSEVYLSIIGAAAIIWIIFIRSRGYYLIALIVFPQCVNTMRLAAGKWDKYATGEEASDDNYFWAQVWTAFAVVHFLLVPSQFIFYRNSILVGPAPLQMAVNVGDVAAAG